jgi:hypothetical protein
VIRGDSFKYTGAWIHDKQVVRYEDMVRIGGSDVAAKCGFGYVECSEGILFEESQKRVASWVVLSIVDRPVSGVKI